MPTDSLAFGFHVKVEKYACTFNCGFFSIYIFVANLGKNHVTSNFCPKKCVCYIVTTDSETTHKATGETLHTMRFKTFLNVGHYQF